MSDDGRSSGGARKQPGSNPRRPTQAQSIRRQQQIVADRDGGNMTFSQIAKKHGMDEREVRRAYERYIAEIAPLMTAVVPEEKLVEYLRALESARQQFARIAQTADNDSAKVGALREVVRTIFREVELYQHLGLLPKNLGDVRIHWERRWVVEQVVSVLERHDMPAEAFQELEEIFSSDVDDPSA